MQIRHQLAPSYHSINDVITNTKPFPSFLEANNILLLHDSHEQSINGIVMPYNPFQLRYTHPFTQTENQKINLMGVKTMGNLVPKEGVILMSHLPLILFQVHRLLRDRIKLFLAHSIHSDLLRISHKDSLVLLLLSICLCNMFNRLYIAYQ